MAIVIAHHRVKDFSAWKPFYDADISRRKNAGIHDWKVTTKKDDPNDVYMIWEVDDPEKLQGMFSDPELKAIIDKAGVITPPEVVLLLDSR